MNSNSRSSATISNAWRTQRFISMCAAALLVFVASGCQSLPPVTSPPPGNAQTITAGTDLDWTSKGQSCRYARSEVKKAAKRECELSSFTIAPGPCDCQRSQSDGNVWHCSTAAVYTCEGGHSIGLAATK
jgi:hypothetical protein